MINIDTQGKSRMCKADSVYMNFVEQYDALPKLHKDALCNKLSENIENFRRKTGQSDMELYEFEHCFDSAVRGLATKITTAGRSSFLLACGCDD